MATNYGKVPDNPLVQAIHTAVKGRARYKVNGLYRSEAIKRYLELRLSGKKGIAQVRANHYTGNVLVLFHPNFSPNAIAQLIQDIILDYRTQFKKLPASVVPTGNFNDLNNKTPVTTTENNQNIFTSAILPQTNSQIVLASGAVCALAFSTGLLHRYGLDQGILLAIQKLHTPFLDRIMLGITFVGEPVIILLICLAFRSALLHYKRPLEANTLGIAAVGAIGLNYSLKVLFARARPALWDWIINVGHYSFPSGHAMVSMVIYGFIGYILAKEFPQQQKQIFAFTTGLIIAIGLSRLYLGVHWATDVLAGYAVGLAWLIACILSLELKFYRT
jgi:membrane-associated phospholipid phosphatase